MNIEKIGCKELSKEELVQIEGGIALLGLAIVFGLTAAGVRWLVKKIGGCDCEK